MGGENNGEPLNGLGRASEVLPESSAFGTLSMRRVKTAFSSSSPQNESCVAWGPVGHTPDADALPAVIQLAPPSTHHELGEWGNGLIAPCSEPLRGPLLESSPWM